MLQCRISIKNVQTLVKIELDCLHATTIVATEKEKKTCINEECYKTKWLLNIETNTNLFKECYVK